MVPAMSAGRFSDIRRFDQLDSTNRYLLDEARAGAPEGVVAVAAFQSAGRGRLGRRWEAPPGTNLLASVLLRPVLDPDDLHLCTAALALAAAQAIETVAGVAPGVKWPNDLLVAGHKLAGVLAEADWTAPGGPPGSVAVVAGIGINVGWPGPPESKGTSLSALGVAADLEELLEALLCVLEERVDQLDTAQGRAALAAQLHARCVTLGQWVRVEEAGASFEGRAVGIAGGGQLRVETDQGLRCIAAGDVVHVRPAEDPSEPASWPKGPASNR
jgi:BirA family transcriptional regulator, biotin operon repressor / biotin---[acetyl-CoA-carboxylase] ligase